MSDPAAAAAAQTTCVSQATLLRFDFERVADRVAHTSSEVTSDAKAI